MVCFSATIATARAAEKSAPPATVASSKVIDRESQPLGGSVVKKNATGMAKNSSAAADTESALPQMDIARVALALAAVLSLILVLRWAAGRFLGIKPTGRGGMMRVVSRLTVAPKQQLMLVQIGRRLVVVGDSGTVLSRVCEITDPDEVAQLMNAEQATNVKGESFAKRFGKATDRFDEHLGEPEPPPPARVDGDNIEATRGDLTGLADRIREMTQRMRDGGAR